MTLLLLAELMIGAGVLVYHRMTYGRISTDPKELYETALIRNLSETGVTCAITQGEEGTTKELVVALDVVSRVKAHSKLTVKTSDTTVQTEELAVGKDEDYIRYVKVDSSAANSEGRKIDYSKILGQWIKTEGDAPRLYEQSALGGCVVPFAKLPTRSQMSLSQAIRSNKVFVADFDKVENGEINKEPVKIYTVNIAPEAYANYMQSVGKAAGLRLLEKVQSSQFADKKSRQARFSVSVKTGQLMRIQFMDESRSVTFAKYGEAPTVKRPQTWLTNAKATELMHRVQ